MVSAEKFYGRRLPLQDKIESLLKKSPINYCRRNPEPPCLKRLLGPSLTWKVFSKQADALACARNGTDLISFAFEVPECNRQFLTCHPLRLWHEHDNWSKQKCTYEIIADGVPCKLYLDLEFEYQYNALSNYSTGERMVNTYLDLLIGMLKKEVEIDCSREDFLDLDSSTSTKFSRHIILNISRTAFVNNLAVGRLVKGLCCRIVDHINTSEPLFGVSKELLRTLFVADRKGEQKMFVDLSVYTKNRHFRLLGSTKLHKNAPLVVSMSNMYQPHLCTKYAFFMESLVTYFEEKPTRLVQYGDERPYKEQAPSFAANTGAVSMKCTGSLTSLDTFIMKVVAPRGRIRQKSCAGDRIQYDICNYRYCANISREHRSNNIAVHVHLPSMTFYQTCYDPDCSGYRSASMPLPAHLIFDLLEPVTDTIAFSEAADLCFDSLSDWDFEEIQSSLENEGEDIENVMMDSHLVRIAEETEALYELGILS